jgi:hypothetical protein
MRAAKGGAKHAEKSVQGNKLTGNAAYGEANLSCRKVLMAGTMFSFMMRGGRALPFNGRRWQQSSKQPRFSRSPATMARYDVWLR